MIRKRAVFCALLVVSLTYLFSHAPVSAHRSGCHRWHTCPSDHGTYTQSSTSPEVRSRVPQESKTSPPEPETLPSQVKKPIDNPIIPQVRKESEDVQSLQDLERRAEEHPCERDYAREGEERVEQCKWDILERALLTYCRQVSPLAIQKCIYTELVRQDPKHVNPRAEKYALPRSPR